jgi:uncharacterized damage-inducible protein DinB
LSTREFLVARRNAEQPAFRRVLDALPSSQWDFKPHERSPSAAGIAWTLTSEAVGCCDLARQGYVDWQPSPAPAAADEIRALHERSYVELTRLVGSLSEEAWARSGQFRVGGKTMIDLPLGELLWFFFFDAIHHRGQLSTYIRPMGGKVPAIYGPSGDDPGR